MDKELLEILVCPETHQSLKAADAPLLERLNGLINAGKLKNLDRDVVVDPMEEGLLREDGARIYPIREGIPIMLVGEAVDLASLDA